MCIKSYKFFYYKLLLNLCPDKTFSKFNHQVSNIVVTIHVMSSECTSAEELDVIFDDIFMFESKVAEQATAEGSKKAEEEADANGYHLGYHQGLEVGFEIGHYEGLTDAFLKLHEENKMVLSDKVLKILEKLKGLLKNFPHFNCPDTLIDERRKEIKSLAKQLCSLLKFDGMLSEGGLSF